jgi:DNA-binding Lrp family transcriptional regulator
MDEGTIRRRRPLDKMNVRIVNLLQRDAKMTTAEIARRINRAESTIRERIYAMEREGIIQGYAAIVDKAALGYSAEALLFCNIPSAIIDDTLAKLERMKNVVGIFLVSGDRRFVVRIAAHDNRELREFVHRKLIPMGIIDVDTRIIMDYREKLPPGGIVDDELD